MERKGVKRWGLVLLMAMGLYGCAGPYSLVEFEVLEPATVNFPADVENLVILNRAPFTLDVISEQNREGMKREHLIMVDTLITNHLFRGVREVMNNSPFPTFQYPVWLTERRSDTAGLEDLVLTRREVADLCRETTSDAVISLEFYSVALDEEYTYYSDDPTVVRTHFYEVSNEILWNIYLPDRPRPFDEYRMVDTLFFPVVVEGQFQIVPSLTEMIAELFFSSGVKYGQYLVPVWTPAARVVIRGRNDSLKTASKLTSGGEWEEAYHLWRDLTRSDDSAVAAKAYHNLAVFYELEDRLDSASFLIDQALKLDALEVTRNYREKMDTRLQNREILESQISR